MRGLLRKVLGLGLLGVLLAMPVLLAQRPTGGGHRSGGKKGGKRGGKAGKKAPSKGGGSN